MFETNGGVPRFLTVSLLTTGPNELPNCRAITVYLTCGQDSRYALLRTPILEMSIKISATAGLHEL